MPLSTISQKTMEKTPFYFQIRTINVPERVYCMNTNIKLILSVRDPVKRLISDYTFNKYVLQNHRESQKNFTLEHYIFLPGTMDINERYPPVQVSRYAENLRRWLKYFPMENILIVNSDDFTRNPVPVLKKIEIFLGLRNYFSESQFVYDAERGFYCRVIDGMEKCAPPVFGLPKEYVSPEVIERLQQYYKPHNEDFSKLVGKNFNW